MTVSAQDLTDLAAMEFERVELRELAAYSGTRVAGAELDETTFVGVDNLLPGKRGKTAARYLPNTDRVTAYEVGDVLLGNIRPYLQKVWLADYAGGCSGDVLAVRIDDAAKPRIQSRYLYYVLSSDHFFMYNTQHSKGGKMPRGSKEAIMKYQVPVPPVEGQRTIVAILDEFIELERALDEELLSRRQQFAHYRDRLLTFNDDSGVVARTLDDVTSSISSGRNKSRQDSGTFPVYGSTGLLGYTEEAGYEGQVLLVARVGHYAGMVNAAEGQFDVSDNTLVVRPTEEWDFRFAFHQLTHMNLNQYAVGGGQPLVTGGLLKRLEIRLPPITEQRRIADALDDFHALVDSADEGLPAELRARRQQLEHYRNHLLRLGGSAE